ncbi:MAG: ABC transporter permease [Fusobacterium sp.]|nr:ABC transporter permease [Fusobacterium sp.]
MGYFIALTFALLLSVCSLYSKSIMEYLDWSIQFFRNVPPLGMIPLLILWFGIGKTSKIIIIFLASFFPMLLNIEKGFKSTDIKLIEVGKSFGFTKFQILEKIIFPYAIPDILVGARIGLGYSYRAIIGAEMIASSSGLGYMIIFAKSMSNTSTVIVGIIVIGLLGLACDFLFKFFIELFLKDKKGYGWD